MKHIIVVSALLILLGCQAATMTPITKKGVLQRDGYKTTNCTSSKWCHSRANGKGETVEAFVGPIMHTQAGMREGLASGFFHAADQFRGVSESMITQKEVTIPNGERVACVHYNDKLTITAPRKNRTIMLNIWKITGEASCTDAAAWMNHLYFEKSTPK